MRQRFLLVPAIALTASAQQQSPAAAEAEAALRARVNQFYQLEVDKKFRQAESFIAEDSKDLYYNESKPDIKGFSVDQIELSDDNTRARVHIKTKFPFTIPGAPEPIMAEPPAIVTWKIEKGEWVMYVDREAGIETPFGKLKLDGSNQSASSPQTAFKIPDLSAVGGMVKIDRDSVVLTAAAPAQEVTVTNSLPGDVDLKVSSGLYGVETRIEKPHLASGEKTVVHLRSNADQHLSGVVGIQVLPIGRLLEIRVTAN